MDIKKEVNAKNYPEYVKMTQPGSNLFTDCLKAFFFGGIICTIGQGINLFGEQILHLNEDEISCFTALVLIFIGALLTGLGVYDIIGRYALAGSILPITGFSNSIVSSAMEFKHEGFVLGVGAKLFTIAGPVLVYGISASVAVGIIYYLIGLLGGGAVG